MGGHLQSPASGSVMLATMAVPMATQLVAESNSSGSVVLSWGRTSVTSPPGHVSASKTLGLMAVAVAATACGLLPNGKIAFNQDLLTILT
jgi:hypothetical protein